ncbi:uncharacterized protein LOC115210758 isoform X1 [Octopus sinensis]|uniref:Uncharacterized protein LOC115210758 isoform X1 n=1 Tax=Octopus sinensis TaxID=2607531 RepID=A0A6P7SBI0_9MOLL|nr:uncharacterized protein LOC115210758 isoform X1 [Octopus sinensis]
MSDPEFNLTTHIQDEEARIKKMSAERPVKRAGRRGRKPSKIDQKARLERSRQSARECRARKKLRYQYLEELVVLRERSIFSLRDELERLRQWCTQMDNGHIPAGLQDMFLAQSSTSKSNTSEYTPVNSNLQTPKTVPCVSGPPNKNIPPLNHTVSIPEEFQISQMVMPHEEVNYIKTENYHHMQHPPVTFASSNCLMSSIPCTPDFCTSSFNQPYNKHMYCNQQMSFPVQNFKYPALLPTHLEQ